MVNGFSTFCDSQFTWIHKMHVIIQFNSIHLFLCAQKRPFLNYISIEFQYVLFKVIAYWSGFNSRDSYTFAQFIHRFIRKNAANTSPLNIASSQLQSRQFFFDVSSNFNEMKKNQYFTIVFPLPLRRKLKGNSGFKNPYSRLYFLDST